MKRVIFLLSLLLLTVSSQAQRERKELVSGLNINGVLKTAYKGNAEGTQLTLSRILTVKGAQDEEYNGTFIVVDINDAKVAVPIKSAHKVLKLNPANTDEFWISEYLDNQMYRIYSRKGYRPSIRNELMSEANDYVSSLSGALYKDAYIQDYIQQIYLGIAPQQLDNKRPERLRVDILQSPNPDVYMLPNGTLLISTGLLSTIDSVEELTALIASEMTHYVLDHQVLNIAKERARIRRAEVWGAVLSIAAAGAEIVLMENNEHYIPGGIMLSTEIAGDIMSSTAISKMGMGYSDKQYFVADDIAVKFLELNGMDTGALASALYKIQTYYHTTKDSYALSNKGGYGNVSQRIQRLGEVKEIGNRNFQKAMAGVTTVNAIIQQNNKNYQEAERLIEKNIKNKLASDEDYLVWIQSNMSRTNSPEDNQRNLDLIQQVKATSSQPNLGICKQEILLLLRMNKQSKAIEELQKYMTMLTEFKEQGISSDDTDWANDEMSWATRYHNQILKD